MNKNKLVSFYGHDKKQHELIKNVLQIHKNY